MKAVKQRMQDQGLKPVHVKHAVLLIVADAYLDLHRDELLEEAAERIAAWPDLRKMAEQEAKRRVKAIQKTSLQQRQKAQQ